MKDIDVDKKQLTIFYGNYNDRLDLAMRFIYFKQQVKSLLEIQLSILKNYA